MADFDSICAVLCLMTRAAADEDMPMPVSRPAMRRLLSSGGLHGLVLRHTDGIEPALLARARVLLSRAKAVYQCLEGYRERGYEVILPQDAFWPRRLFAMGDRMPQFLFLRGNKELLSKRMIAVAGSRDIPRDVWDASCRLGKRIADEGFCLVSGCARGVDMGSESGALRAGGSAVLVPALPDTVVLERKPRRDALEGDRLLVVYDTLPDDPFSAQRALARNRTIYALGEAAIAVAPRDRIGGTWHGAADCLHMGCTPVFVPEGEALAGMGGAALIARGARIVGISRPLAGQLFCAGQTDLFSVCGEEGLPCR